MKALRLQILMGLAWLSATALVEAGPLRLLVQPPCAEVRGTDLRDRGRCADQCLALYLYDWFLAAPEVRLIDEGQAASVFGAVLSPAYVRGPESVFPAMRSLVAVDGVIAWEWRAGTLTLRVHRAGGAQSREIAWPDVQATSGAVKAATDWLAAELGVEAKTSPLGRGMPADNPQFIEDYYLTQRYRAEWQDNSGAAQLEILRPCLVRLPKDLWAAAAIIRAGRAMSVDGRGVARPASLVMMLRQALPSLLGTAWEPLTRRLCEVNRHQPEAIETDLLAMIRTSGQDEVERIMESAATGDFGMEAIPHAGGVMATLGGTRTPAQQAGAIRLLGVMKSQAALAHFERIAKVKDAPFRQAVAWALAQYPAPAGAAELDALRQDADAQTAFYAAWGLWRRRQTPDGTAQAIGEARHSTGDSSDPAAAQSPHANLTRRAIACLDVDPDCEEALEVLAANGTVAGVAHLNAGLAFFQGRLRALAVSGLLRLGKLDADGVEAALADPDAGVIRAALAGLPLLAPGDGISTAPRERLMVLANHPDTTIAEAARARLALLAPAEPRARRQFELAIEHPYVRRQIVQALTRDPADEALSDLDSATTNVEAHTRALALRGLAQRNPARARARLPALLADPHRLVRLQAAAVAAAVATAAERGTIEKALSENPDDAARLYLQDALARSQGQAVPAARPAVNHVSAETNLSFNCGVPSNGGQTPFDGFYIMNTPAAEQGGAAMWQTISQAQAAGKVILPRANKTARNPAQVFLNPGWQDGFWLGLDEEFGEHWEAMDGVVLGEESMYFGPYDEWANGWRLFCREAGLDPRRVNGDREKLTESEQQAWWDWEQRVAVEGFNAMVDTIRLRYGKLRPGFQVATFMPDQNGPCAYDRQWDFDIAAGYYYAAPSRTRYAAIRRLKTTWPDRPVLWLNQGKVGVGLGLNETAIQYSTPVPASPLHSLTDITSADALCTWLAGGNTGLFSIYLFVHVGWTGEDFGEWVGLEDITPSSPVFAEALEHSFRGLGKKYQLGDEIKAAKPEVSLADDVELFDFDDPAQKGAPYVEREKSEKEAFRQGFLLERRLIQDGVNLFSGVAFPPHKHEVLLVGPQEMRAPGFDLANDFDCLVWINHLGEIDLGRYRLLGLTGQANAALRDTTIQAVTGWLLNTPGVLYVHGWVSTERTNAALTALDLCGQSMARSREKTGNKTVGTEPDPPELTMEGRPPHRPLLPRWPWAGDVTAIFGKTQNHGREVEGVHGFEVKPGSATVLMEREGRAVLVFWQGQGMQGGVLFDAGKLEAAELQPIYNDLVKRKAVGVALTGPIGMEAVATPEFSALASCGAAIGPYRLSGVDALSGVRDPELGPGRSSALTAKTLRGKYLACANGVAVLGDRPLEQVEQLPGGLKVKGGGLLQAVSSSGVVMVTAEGGAVPAVAEKDLLNWMFASEHPGMIALGRTNTTARTTFVRAPGWVTFRCGDKERECND